MKKNFRQFASFSIFALIIFSAVILMCVKNASAKIENSVSATANTGGNKISGSGEIKTGDASASVNAQNYVNGGESAQTNVEAKAEVQGDNAQASVEVNGKKDTCESSSEEGCRVEISNSGGDNNSADSTDSADKGVIGSIAGALSNFTKNITDKIISWFS